MPHEKLLNIFTFLYGDRCDLLIDSIFSFHFSKLSGKQNKTKSNLKTNSAGPLFDNHTGMLHKSIHAYKLNNENIFYFKVELSWIILLTNK